MRVRIGDVSAATGVDRQTIRFYERRGLLPVPARESNGYRRYDEAVLTRLQFIGDAQSAGFSLAEITSILGLRETGDSPCAHVAHLLDQKLDDVRARQRELADLAAELEHLIAAAEDLDPTDCTDDEICQIITTPGGTDAHHALSHGLRRQ